MNGENRMASVIVFSKDRPLQLHAYLESLIAMSEIEQKDISVLYCEKNEISYSKVRKYFHAVNWIRETEFDTQLRRIVADAGNYIMFGCDDVIFTHKFCIREIELFLNNTKDVLGITLRLGNNIKPKPKNQFIKDGFSIWDWANSRERHYNYPWELDCTVYRKDDVIALLSGYKEKIKNPNYLESNFVNKINHYLDRPLLGCYSDISKAIVLTINRVQEDFINPFDDLADTSVESLAYLYNVKNNRIDYKAISKINNTIIHVDSKYFILKNYNLRFRIYRLKRKLIKLLLSKNHNI